jgi:RecA-family ATPase
VAILLSDFMSQEIIQKPSIIGRGLLPRESKLIIGGAPKSNKSFLGLNIGLSLAKGMPLFDAVYDNGTPVFPVTKPHKVLLIEQEVGPVGLKNRLNGILDAKPQWYFSNFYIKSRNLSLQMDTEEGVAAIDREIEERQPEVLIIDPLSKMHNKDENSSQDMGKIMKVGDYWIGKYGLSIIYIHHTGTASYDPTSTRRGGAKLRGSTTIFADVDSVIDLVRCSSVSAAEPTLELNIEMRQGEPMDVQYVKKNRNGTIDYLGEGATGAANRNRR